MRLAHIRISALAAGLLACPNLVAASVPSRASVSIEAPATANVVQDIMRQANILVTVIGTPAPTMSLNSASLATGAEESFQFATSTIDLTPTNGLILAQDAVSVNISPITPEKDGGQSGSASVIVVLAQYN